MPHAAWLPHAAGTPAKVGGAAGRWLDEQSDIFPSIAAAELVSGSGHLPLAFPRNWPQVFKGAALQELTGKTVLQGIRCRATALNAGSEGLGGAPEPVSLARRPSEWRRGAAPLARSGEVEWNFERRSLHSFEIAERAAAAMGWGIVRGFVILEMTEYAPGERFVALKHWLGDHAASRACVVVGVSYGCTGTCWSWGSGTLSCPSSEPLLCVRTVCNFCY